MHRLQPSPPDPLGNVQPAVEENVFGNLLYSAGYQHGNQTPRATSTVTHSILLTHTGPCICHA